MRLAGRARVEAVGGGDWLSPCEKPKQAVSFGINSFPIIPPPSLKHMETIQSIRPSKYHRTKYTDASQRPREKRDWRREERDGKRGQRREMGREEREERWEERREEKREKRDRKRAEKREERDGKREERREKRDGKRKEKRETKDFHSTATTSFDVEFHACRVS